VGFEYVRLARLSSVSEAMRDARFAQRRPVPTDLSWLPAIGALLVLVWRFSPAAPSAFRRSATITPRWKLIARRLVVRPRARF